MQLIVTSTSDFGSDAKPVGNRWLEPLFRIAKKSSIAVRVHTHTQSSYNQANAESLVR